MTDTARILGTARVVCTAKQPATDGTSRLGFCSDTWVDDGAVTVSASGLSVVMPDQGAQHIEIGTHLTLLFTDGEVG